MLSYEGVNDSNVESFSDYAFISIVPSPDLTSALYTPYFSSDHANVLNLVFDDLTPADMDKVWSKFSGAVLFTKEQAIKVIKFVEQNKDRKFIVHCSAGVSRSGAVGNFIRQMLGLDHQTFMRDNTEVQPNGYVMNVLAQAYGEINVG